MIELRFFGSADAGMALAPGALVQARQGMRFSKGAAQIGSPIYPEVVGAGTTFGGRLTFEGNLT